MSSALVSPSWGPGMFALPLLAGGHCKDRTVIKQRILNIETWMSAVGNTEPHRLAQMHVIGVLYFWYDQPRDAMAWFEKILAIDASNLNAAANKLFVWRAMSMPRDVEGIDICELLLAKAKSSIVREDNETLSRQVARSYAEQAHTLSMGLTEVIVGKRDYQPLNEANEYFSRALRLMGHSDATLDDRLMSKFNMARNKKRMGLDNELSVGERQRMCSHAIELFAEILQEPFRHEYDGSCWNNLGHIFGQVRFEKEVGSSILGVIERISANDNHNWSHLYNNPSFCFKNAIKDEPNSFKHYIFYAKHLMHEKLVTEALKQIEHSLCIESSKANCMAYTTRARIIYQAYKSRIVPQEQLERAIADLKFVQTHQPSAWNLSQIGVFHLCLAQYGSRRQWHGEQALRYTRQSTQSPDGRKDPAIHKHRGQCLKHFGKYGDAIESFKRVVDTDSDNNCRGSANMIALSDCQFLYYRQTGNSPAVLREAAFWFTHGYNKYSSKIVRESVNSLRSINEAELRAMCELMTTSSYYGEAALFLQGLLSKPQQKVWKSQSGRGRGWRSREHQDPQQRFGNSRHLRYF